MHEDVQLTECLCRLLKDSLNLFIGGDVTGFNKGRTDRFGQWAYPALELLAGVGKTERSTLCVERLGDPPGDGVIIGYAEDQGCLSFQESGHEMCSSCHRRIAPLSTWKRQGRLFQGSGTLFNPTRGPVVTFRFVSRAPRSTKRSASAASRS